MGIHMDLDYHEPPNGDFVVLIERMVGMPPSDPETAGRELSAQLRDRAKARDAANALELGDRGHLEEKTYAGDTYNNPLGGPPDISDALASMSKSGLRLLLSGVSKLLIFGGIGILLATGFAGIPLPLSLIHI